MVVVLVSNDLMTASRLEAAAARVGATICVVRTNVESSKIGEQSGPQLVLVDLSTPSIDVGEIVQTVKRGGPHAVIAFGPHVHEVRLAAARDAGCDLVVSRGQFFAQMEAILAEYLPTVS